MSLLELLNIDRVEEYDFTRFETRRKNGDETVRRSWGQGVIDDKWVWFIEPMQVLNLSKIRIDSIRDEINEVQIPLLERDENQRFESIVGTYKREKVYRFGKLKYDRVIIESNPLYKSRR